MKNRAVITFGHAETDRFLKISGERDAAEALKALAELEKRISEFVEPR